MSDTTDYKTVRIRDEIMAQAREAHDGVERAREHFAAPYSGREAERRMHEATGYWRGLWRAVEIIDALNDASSSEVSG